jgi:tryptophan-rich sensory protein
MATLAVGLGISVLLSFGAASFGAIFGPGAWYASLAKPTWNPPGWVFGPVWTVLYLMMAVAAWVVWRSGRPAAVALPLALYGVQLVLNALWSWIFFGLHRPGLAFAELLCLWLAILGTMLCFHRHSRAACWMLAPYLAWVSFASVLNLAIWRLNAGAGA